jgi:AraC-like DNA-binding protein
MIEFDFYIGNYDDTLSQITTWLGSKPVKNVIHIDEFTINGSLLITELEQGFYIKAWDYQLKEDTKFYLRATDSNHPLVFMITYFFTPDSFYLDDGKKGAVQLRKINQLSNTLFTSNKTDFAFNVKASMPVKALDITFSYDWLMAQYSDATKDRLSDVLFDEGDSQPAIFETFSIDDYKMISEIMDKAFNNDWDLIFLKSRVLTMVNTLIANILSKNDVLSNKTPGYLPVLINVEKKLSSILHEKLPNLKEIAKEFSLSESTLKRQFKQVYGKAIYEYYLFKKMELAKRMLMENNMTISQVAYSLGYEKASPFIRIFKRQFGMSPGSLRSVADKSSTPAEI